MKMLFLFIFILLSNAYLNSVFANGFYINHLTQAQQKSLIASGLWKPGCPVKLDDLRLISVNYYDMRGNIHRNGQIIVNKYAAKDTLTVFRQLYYKKFPFSSIETLLTRHGDTRLAEEKNITYGFACHRDDENHFSPTSFGSVLTINPTLNPEINYVSDKKNPRTIISPNSGILSINRSLQLNGMSEPIYSYLRRNNFIPLDLGDRKIGWKRFIFYTKKEKITQHPSSVSKKKNIVSPTRPVFSYQPLSSEMKKNLKKSRMWFEGCPVPLNRLNVLTLSYYGFDNKVHQGRLIMYDAIAPHIADAFKELYRRQFPIEKFDISYASDNNENTSAFNCRSMVGKNNYSLHSYGLAIDINVSRNPYIGLYRKTSDGKMIGAFIPSPSSMSYLDRTTLKPGMNEQIVDVLAKHGFITWGGNWQDTIDYMHFQVPSGIAKHLTSLDKESAKKMIELIIKYPEAAKHMPNDTRWDYLYKLYPKNYITALQKHFSRLKTKDESEVINLVYKELI